MGRRNGDGRMNGGGKEEWRWEGEWDRGGRLRLSCVWGRDERQVQYM